MYVSSSRGRLLRGDALLPRGVEREGGERGLSGEVGLRGDVLIFSPRVELEDGE